MAERLLLELRMVVIRREKKVPDKQAEIRPRLGLKNSRLSKAEIYFSRYIQDRGRDFRPIRDNIFKARHQDGKCRSITYFGPGKTCRKDGFGAFFSGNQDDQKKPAIYTYLAQCSEEVCNFVEAPVNVCAQVKQFKHAFSNHFNIFFFRFL